MIHVLFVCLGNICRSPMAEAIFRHKVKEAGLDRLIRVDSAGTGDWHRGQPPHRGTQEVLRERRIDADGLVARTVERGDFDRFDYIVAMDEQNVRDLRRLAGDGAKIVKMLDYHPEKPGGDVPDPYFTGNFKETYELLEVGCTRLLERVRGSLEDPAAK